MSMEQQAKVTFRGDSKAWVWVAFILAIVLSLLAWVSFPQQLPDSTVFAKAEIQELNADGQLGPARVVSLPHFWDEDRQLQTERVRYRMHLPAINSSSAQPQNWGLLMTRVGARFQVRLDGQLIHSAFWRSEDYVDTTVVPHWIVLPASYDPAQAHVLEVDVDGLKLRKSGLGHLVLGPADEIRSRHERIVWWQVYLTWMVAACSGMLSLMTGLIWTATRERMFGWLAIAAFAWMLRLILTPLVQPAMPFEAWFFLHKLSFTFYCGFLYLFLWDLFGIKDEKGRYLIWLLLWVSPVWIIAIILTGNYDGYRLWTGFFALISVWTFFNMMRRARWGLDANQRLIVVVSAVTLVTGLRDFLVVQFGALGDADFRWMTPGSLVFMLTLSLVLVQRMARYVDQIQAFNEELNLKVRDKEVELTQAFEQIRQAETQQVLIKERARLTRDMHDGLGSHLVQTLNAVRSGSQISITQLEQMLSTALEELRMTIDSLENMEGDLPTMLGTLRRRIGPTMEVAGIDLEWAVEDVPALLDKQGKALEAKSVMHLFRCLQEVFANVIKHARATRVRVATSLTPAGVVLDITDNGQGMRQEQREGGRGLDNIRLRAQSIGALVEWFSSEAGTQVRFVFPLHAG